MSEGERSLALAFDWLPDAAQDRHPGLTWLVVWCFDVTIESLFRREAIYPPDYELDPGTLVVSNHQRDSDVPLLSTAICRRDGHRFLGPLPVHAVREDLFREGILGDLFADWPRPLPQLLGRVPVRWLFQAIRGEPVRRIREFTLGEAVAALVDAGFGGARLGEIFNPRAIRRLGARLGELPATLAELDDRRLGALRRSFWGLRWLRREALRQLEPEFEATIERQLGRLAACLASGRVVYFAPEGTLSPSGEFRRVRDGAWRLFQLAQAPPLLPCALSYDPLAPGRLRAIVRIGEPVARPEAGDRQHFDALVRHEILALYPVTPSHLVARFLAAGPREFTTAECADWMRAATAEIRGAGLTLDPLVERQPAGELAEERLGWLERKRLVRARAGRWRSAWRTDAAPGWSSPAGEVAYLERSLGELAGLAPGLGERLVP